MSENFNWVYYVNRYKDLKKANINTYETAYKHWISFGKKEGRECNEPVILKNKLQKKPIESPKLQVQQKPLIQTINLQEEINKDILNEYYIDKEKSKDFEGRKIIAVIPVHGRELLLKYTIRRLYNKNKLYKVICVGDTDKEKEIVLQEKGIWVKYKNNPLGKKWNIGFKIAQIYNPDAILFVGSSDWISSDWLDEAYKYINDFGIIGKHEFTMADITNKELKMCHWLGYPTNTDRNEESIGIGRLVSKKLLEIIDYLPFDNNLNSSMDWSMYCKCIKNNFKVKILNNNSIFLSISCDLWINKHKFLYHYLACSNKMAYLSLDLFQSLNEIYFRTKLLDEDNKNKINNEFPELEEFKKDYLEYYNSVNIN
jgi:hypothetical protein